MEPVTIILITNPFKPQERQITKKPPNHAITLAGHVRDCIGDDTNTTFVASVNGRVVPCEQWQQTAVAPGSYVTIIPVVEGGDDEKNPLAVIAGIALMIYTNGLASNEGFIASMGSKAAAQFAAAAISYVGGMVINRLFPPPVPDFSNLESSANPSYNWGRLQSLQSQGNPLAVTYGTMRSAGQIIGQHVTSEYDKDKKDYKQYLNILLLAGEGELDRIDDIKINDNPIANYDDVTYAVRFGTNDQKIIDNFAMTYSDQELSYTLTWNDTLPGDTLPGSVWTQQDTESLAAEGLEVTLYFPNGLYHLTNSSDPEETWVDLAIEYQKKNAAKWLTLTGDLQANCKISSGLSLEAVSKPQVLNMSGRTETETWEVKCSETEFIEYNSETGSGYYLTTKVAVYYKATESSPPSSPVIVDNQVYHSVDGEFYGQYSDGKVSFRVDNTIVGIKEGDLIAAVTLAKDNATRIIDKQTSSFSRTYRLDNLDPGQYTVRAKVTGKQGTTTRYANTVMWIGLSSIIYDKFTYPGKALVGLKILANDQLSGSSPSITWLQARNNVYVYDTTLAAYRTASATNPAWVCYDMIHRCRKIKRIGGSYEYTVFGVPASRLNFTQFKAWADFCDDNNLKFNHIFDSASDLFAALKKPESVGRGRVVLQGTTYSCIYDHHASPVQMFTMSNIMANSFKEHYLGIKDRANVAEITFVDSAKNYSRSTLSVYSDDYNATNTTINSTQITLDGCTSLDQAYKHGKYLLRLNKYLKRTAEWEADVDAIACQVGDVVLVSHDVPQWGASGRIAAVQDLNLLSQAYKDGTDTGYVKYAGTGTFTTNVSDRLYHGDMVMKAVGYCWMRTDFITIDPTKQVYGELDIMLGETGGSYTLYMGMEFYDGSGVAAEGNGGCNNYFVASGINLSSYGGKSYAGKWLSLKGNRLPPATATQMRLRLLLNYNAPVRSTQTMYVGNIGVRSGDYSATVTLDKSVTLKANKSYTATIRRAKTDQISSYSLISDGADRIISSLSLAHKESTVFLPGDLFSIGEDRHTVKPFTVVEITRSQDQYRKITAVEYAEAVYSESTETAVIESTSVTRAILRIDTTQDHYRQNNGTIVSAIYLAWIVSSGKWANGYRVGYQKTTDFWWRYLPDTVDQKAVIPNVEIGSSYRFVVHALGSNGSPITSKATDVITITGRSSKPASVSNFTVTYDSELSSNVLKWNKNTEPDIKGYELQVTFSGGQSISLETNIVTNQYTHRLINDTEHVYEIRAVDTSGNYSDEWTTARATAPNAVPITATTFKQDPASATWVIPHTFPYSPAVTVVDTGGSTIIGTVSYSSKLVTIIFSGATTGTAYLS